MIEALIGAGKMGATPQPRGPAHGCGIAAILDLKTAGPDRGRRIHAAKHPAFPRASPWLGHAASTVPEAVSPIWQAMTAGGSIRAAKLLEQATDSRLSLSGYALGAQEGDVQWSHFGEPKNNEVNKSDAAYFGPPRRGHDRGSILTIPQAINRTNGERSWPPCDSHAKGTNRVPGRPRRLRSGHPIRVFWHMGGPCARQSRQLDRSPGRRQSLGALLQAPNSKPRRCCPASSGAIPGSVGWSVLGR